MRKMDHQQSQCILSKQIGGHRVGSKHVLMKDLQDSPIKPTTDNPVE